MAAKIVPFSPTLHRQQSRIIAQEQRVHKPTRDLCDFEAGGWIVQADL